MMPKKAEAERVQTAYKKYKKRLTPKEIDVLSLYYGLDGNVRHTLSEIGEKYLVTRERIRQVKGDALRVLKVKLKRLPAKKESNGN